MKYNLILGKGKCLDELDDDYVVVFRDNEDQFTYSMIKRLGQEKYAIISFDRPSTWWTSEIFFSIKEAYLFIMSFGLGDMRNPVVFDNMKEALEYILKNNNWR